MDYKTETDYQMLRNIRSSWLSKIATAVERVLIFVSIVLAATLTVNLIMAVFFRYVFNSPIYWADELSLILFAWLTFLGGALAVKQSEMAAVTFLIEWFPRKIRFCFQIIIQLLILFFSAVLCYYSYIWITSPSVLNMISSTLQIGMLWIYSVVPLSMICTIVFVINNIFVYVQLLRQSVREGV